MHTDHSLTKRIFSGLPALFCGFLLLASASASALDLDSAKQQGLVGETTSGYLETVDNGREAAALVDQINAQRRAHYQRIATSNNISLADVERLAGQKAIEKTPSGQYIKVGDSWRIK